LLKHSVKILSAGMNIGPNLHLYQKRNNFVMLYNNTMQATFESEKNKKALAYTAIICVVLLALAILITWPIYQPPVPIVQDLIEINLGNNQEGYGDVQPLIKGEMGQTQEEYAPQKAAAAPAHEDAVQPDDNAEKDAASVDKTEKIKTPKTSTAPSVIKTTKPTKAVAVVTPAPKPKKPLSTYKGPGNGTGNGATQDNGYRYQGNNPNGKGDAGDPTGKPDSYGNTPGGKSGGSLIRGTRPLNLGVLRYTDNFNENAKVYVDVKYNSSGSVISTTIAKGTTTSNSNIIGIAKRKANELKFPSNETDGGVSTILFNFSVQN
jgi:hypothetical protein